MPVSTFTQPNFTTQDAASYKANLDAAAAALYQLAGGFIAHEASTPNMTIVVEPGRLSLPTTGGLIFTTGQQTSSTISPPTTNPRIDLAVIDSTSGILSIIEGTEDADPIIPDFALNQLPICKIALSVGQSSITNADITDQRLHVLSPRGRGALVYNTAVQSIPNNTLTTVDWSDEEYDSENIHEASTSPHILLVPTGVRAVRVAANIEFIGNATGRREAYIYKNGAPDYGMPCAIVPAVNGAETIINLSSSTIQVEGGDIFYVRVLQDSGGALDLNYQKSWFSMGIVL